ncbi:unnamed protein product [Allacma fusca]|uniref:Uncharacterized protein n=1 Tax=Allacma fusca TaxID=39272 RepID=A0A8J2K7J5_9HEXA|nr:unnamed protein product [Allacma fusca]
MLEEYCLRRVYFYRGIICEEYIVPEEAKFDYMSEEASVPGARTRAKEPKTQTARHLGSQQHIVNILGIFTTIQSTLTSIRRSPIFADVISGASPVH